MPRLSRKLRLCKWLGTLGCVLIVAALASSVWYGLEFSWNPKRPAQGIRAVYVESGEVGFTQAMAPWWHNGRAQGWRLSPRQSLRKLLYHSVWVPSIERLDPFGLMVRLPLWLPLCALLVPTLLLWRRDRRRPRPGFCRQCDYDLTGNVSGICPECGTPLTEAERAAVAAAAQRAPPGEHQCEQKAQ
jgi:hypothetical protein